MLESIPDGISLQTRGQGRADVYLNHETSLVPFPFTPATGVGQSDYTNAMVSHLTLNQHSAGVLQGRYVIPSSANFQRFCSNFLAVGGAGNGFERTLLFTNEEATDFVNRTGLAWPPGPGAEQAGVVVAYDPQREEYRPIYGMGRHNHENSVAVPGYGHPVLLSGDDTFTAPSSQLYMYTADGAAAVWNDEGSLWAFRSDNPLVNDYSDLSGSATASGALHSGAAVGRARRPDRRSRAGRTRTTCSSSSASRTSPSTGTTRTSSTSLTPASRGRCRARARHA